MRRTREQTADSKARILATAARLLRERGVDGVSIADVMEAAGMTQGGFYRHFTSKSDMVAAATRYAFDDIARRYDDKQRDSGPQAALRDYVDVYLSQGHLDTPGVGCPMAAFGSDAGRLPDVLGPEFESGAARLIERVAASLPSNQDGDGEAERDEAIRRLAMLVGTVIVARAIGDRPLREEVVAACKNGLARSMAPGTGTVHAR
jgi:TetR/AcrR family transcriptional repressor of nem operon